MPKRATMIPKENLVSRKKQCLKKGDVTYKIAHENMKLIEACSNKAGSTCNAEKFNWIRCV